MNLVFINNYFTINQVVLHFHMTSSNINLHNYTYVN